MHSARIRHLITQKDYTELIRLHFVKTHYDLHEPPLFFQLDASSIIYLRNNTQHINSSARASRLWIIASNRPTNTNIQVIIFLVLEPHFSHLYLISLSFELAPNTRHYSLLRGFYNNTRKNSHQAKPHIFEAREKRAAYTNVAAHEKAHYVSRVAVSKATARRSIVIPEVSFSLVSACVKDPFRN